MQFFYFPFTFVVVAKFISNYRCDEAAVPSYLYMLNHKLSKESICIWWTPRPLEAEKGVEDGKKLPTKFANLAESFGDKSYVWCCI